MRRWAARALLDLGDPPLISTFFFCLSCGGRPECSGSGCGAGALVGDVLFFQFAKVNLHFGVGWEQVGPSGGGGWCGGLGGLRDEGELFNGLVFDGHRKGFVFGGFSGGASLCPRMGRVGHFLHDFFGVHTVELWFFVEPRWRGIGREYLDIHRLDNAAGPVGTDALGAGFGPFSTELVRTAGELRGYHASYADYFHTRLDRHLAFLVEKQFLTCAQADDLQREIDTHAALLALPAACLVHKDLALWNILGTSDRIAAFIDFDDTVGGDPLDDISLLGCFHDGATIAGVLAGYATVRPLPADYRRRFWLHLLRNMIWKAVIRVGAGYFERTSGFFLVGAGASGADLRAFTLARIATALRGLRADADPVSLS